VMLLYDRPQATRLMGILISRDAAAKMSDPKVAQVLGKAWGFSLGAASWPLL